MAQIDALSQGGPNRRKIIVLGLSAYAMMGGNETAFATGCDGYLTKPIDPDAFSANLSRHLSSPEADAG